MNWSSSPVRKGLTVVILLEDMIYFHDEEVLRNTYRSNSGTDDLQIHPLTIRRDRYEPFFSVDEEAEKGDRTTG
jgi:hypothetical protein